MDGKLKKVAKRGLVWFLMFWLIQKTAGTAILKSGSSAGTAILCLWYVGSFITMFLIPLVRLYRVNDGEETATPAANEFQRSLRTVADAEAAHRDFPRTTREIFDIREKYAEDLNAIFADTPYGWSWCGPTTICTLMVTEFSTSGNQFYGATFTANVDGRIECVRVSVQGRDLVLYNKPYFQKRQMDQATKDAPISVFLLETVGNAAWEWIDRRTNTISVLSGTIRTLATVVWKDDGSVDRIELSDGVSVADFFKPAKAAEKQRDYDDVESVEGGPPAETAAIQPIDVDTEKRQREDPEAVMAAIMANDDQSAEDAHTCAETETKTAFGSVNLTAPNQELSEEEQACMRQYLNEGGQPDTVDPDVDDSVLENSVKLIYEAEAVDIANAAMYALSSGESEFCMRWPEGVQSEKEALMFAKYTAEHAGFLKAEVRKKYHTVKFFLPRETED